MTLQNLRQQEKESFKGPNRENVHAHDLDSPLKVDLHDEPEVAGLLILLLDAVALEPPGLLRGPLALPVLLLGDGEAGAELVEVEGLGLVEVLELVVLGEQPTGELARLLTVVDWNEKKTQGYHRHANC